MEIFLLLEDFLDVLLLFWVWWLACEGEEGGVLVVISFLVLMTCRQKKVAKVYAGVTSPGIFKTVETSYLKFCI